MLVTKTKSLLTGFLKDPKTVASIANTSEGSAKDIAACAARVGPKIIFEYGPGTGPITKELLKILPEDGHLYAVEMYKPFVETLRTTIDDVKLSAIEGSVLDIRTLVPCSPGTVDVIVSGIPFSHLSKEDQDHVIAEAKALLRPGGLFLIYQVKNDVGHALEKQFSQIEHRRLLFNIPPLHFYEAVK